MNDLKMITRFAFIPFIWGFLRCVSFLDVQFLSFTSVFRLLLFHPCSWCPCFMMWFTMSVGVMYWLLLILTHSISVMSPLIRLWIQAFIFLYTLCLGKWSYILQFLLSFWQISISSLVFRSWLSLVSLSCTVNRPKI